MKPDGGRAILLSLPSGVNTELSLLTDQIYPEAAGQRTGHEAAASLALPEDQAQPQQGGDVCCVKAEQGSDL